MGIFGKTSTYLKKRENVQQQIKTSGQNYAGFWMYQTHPQIDID